MAELRVKGGGEVPIAAGDVVAVGVVDIAGAGARAVLGMRAPGTAALELELTGVGKPSGSGEDGVGPTFGDDVPALCLVQPAPGVSLVAVNRPLTVAEEAPFAHALASLVASRAALRASASAFFSAALSCRASFSACTSCKARDGAGAVSYTHLTLPTSDLV